MMTLSPLDILSTYWLGNKTVPNNPIRDRFIKNFTWDSILKNGQTFEVGPLLHYILEQIDYQQEKISNTVRDQLKKIYYQYMYHTMMFHDKLQQALNILQETRIKVIVLKGAALAETVYKNIALRPMADIDLLIFKKALSKAKEVLFEMGFRKTEYHSLRDSLKEHPFHLRFVKEGSGFPIIIELHWDIAKSPVNVEITEVMQRAVPANIGVIDAHVMYPDDLLLYLCWHTANHHFPRLIWLCDVAQVIKAYGENINWDIIIERSKRWKIRKTVYCSLYLTKNVLGAQVPEKVLSNLQLSKIETQIFQFIILNMEHKEGIMQIRNSLLTIALQLLIIDRLKDQVFFFLNYVWELVFPGISYIKVRYSISKPRLAKLYQFLHPFILIYEGVFWGLEIITRKKLGVRQEHGRVQTQKVGKWESE